jgi:hypothetical protein
VAGKANLDIVNIATWVMQRQASRRRTTALCTSLHFSLREWPTLDCAQFLTHPPWARRDAPLALASTVFIVRVLRAKRAPGRSRLFLDKKKKWRLY